MSKYHIEITFDLTTTVEPDGVHFDAPDEAEDVDTSVSFDSSDVTVSGGSISFDIEAEDEDEAESKAREAVDDGNEVEDYSGLTWLVESVNIDVELVEEEMTLERAVAILKTMLARLVTGGTITEEEQAAFSFLLDHLTR
jgi:hypothetical protein